MKKHERQILIKRAESEQRPNLKLIAAVIAEKIQREGVFSNEQRKV